MTAPTHQYSRWPLTYDERRLVIESLLQIVKTASDLHSIRAARVLLEIDAQNVQAMERLDAAEYRTF